MVHYVTKTGAIKTGCHAGKVSQRSPLLIESIVYWLSQEVPVTHPIFHLPTFCTLPIVDFKIGFYKKNSEKDLEALLQAFLKQRDEEVKKILPDSALF